MKTKTPKRKINVALLRKIQRQILKEPKQFDMDFYFSNNPGWKVPNCGTAACIGGWAVALTLRLNPKKAWAQPYPGDNAESILGLTADQAVRLFNEWHWPLCFRGAERGTKAAAKLACARIDNFIKTGK